jgi:hypothetical protein
MLGVGFYVVCVGGVTFVVGDEGVERSGACGYGSLMYRHSGRGGYGAKILDMRAMQGIRPDKDSVRHVSELCLYSHETNLHRWKSIFLLTNSHFIMTRKHHCACER